MMITNRAFLPTSINLARLNFEVAQPYRKIKHTPANAE